MSDRLLKDFGLRVKRLRADRSISQEGLANLSGLDRTYISGLERGIRNPSLKCLAKVAKGLGIELVDLLSSVGLKNE
jgi:transcriptional regulator with XRE-family HTH domain|tara:strand:+ start:3540 stop:3770 length:231 start_codon:yes stop_codon:yes gene_type:complete